ncbi:hypothetical protein [Verrucomicrobium sp. BvORR034]|uniref:hypothetical protein n=1 Tax=Verrucomicrobium sp. BvORR034 TaxID=1396418 RepID=UPI0006796A9C|nr:hypothetical protein [Verrucomicrobium sp. BvORR034]
MKKFMVQIDASLQDWKEFVSPGEMDAIFAQSKKARLHPLAAVTTDNRLSNSPEVRLWTNDALRIVKIHDSDWLTQLKKHLLSPDFSTAEAALGELRTYAALKQAFGDRVEPIKKEKHKKTPDFLLKMRDGSQMVIEVHTKNPNEPEFLKLEEFHNSVPTNYVDHGRFRMATAETTYRPFGAPNREKKECVTANVISKIAATKSRDTQFPDNIPSVLWLDYQSAEWEPFHLAGHTQPLMSHLGELSTGGIWAGFYGRKNMPIFERTDILPSLCGLTFRMNHEGRFFARDENGHLAHRAHGVMVAFSKDWLLFENPHEGKSLPPIFVTESLKMRWMKLEGSWLQGPERSLQSRIEASVERMNLIARRGWQGLEENSR